MELTLQFQILWLTSDMGVESIKQIRLQKDEYVFGINLTKKLVSLNKSDTL